MKHPYLPSYCLPGIAVEENIRTDLHLAPSFEQGFLFIPHRSAFCYTSAFS